MTEKETFMYQLMNEISGSNAPIVFKGALILKLVLAEAGFTDMERQTRDIDANWIGVPPSMDTLIDTINTSLGVLKSKVYAVAIREHDKNMTAGVSIRDMQTNEELVSMDIDMRPIQGSKIYIFGEISVKGVLISEILSDKITILSNRMIFRRAKDILDVYALAHCVKINTRDIFEMCNDNPERHIGTFDEFNNRQQDVKHAYSKLKGIENKPPFEHVYHYLKNFLQPFVTNDMSPKTWNSNKSSWDDIR